MPPGGDPAISDLAEAHERLLGIIAEAARGTQTQ
jgi:hypothetical protein